MNIVKIPVTAEGVARARQDSMRRNGVGVSVSPELLRHAQQCGELLAQKRRRQSLAGHTCCQERYVPLSSRWCAWWARLISKPLRQGKHRRG